MRGPAVRPDDALLTTARARIAASATTAVARVGRTRDVLFTSCLLLVSGCRVFRRRASATCPRRVADLRMRAPEIMAAKPDALGHDSPFVGNHATSRQTEPVRAILTTLHGRGQELQAASQASARRAVTFCQLTHTVRSD